ncbi:hypothetical protein Kisp02_07840 [Kineosporia sp. NBRC 101731]|nr:hypothetical protein Kisp02_07840 [Kineosporia sp. NBRC 101731]
MTRRHGGKRFWFPILLLRDALGRFVRVRRPMAPKRLKPRVCRLTLPVFIQLELDLA